MRRRHYNPNWNQARAGGPGLEQLQELLAGLRAAYLTYRTAHWQASGDASYGDHLMLQRIYEESEKHVDQVGERIIGYYGVSAVDLADQADRVAQWTTRFAREQDPVRASLAASESVRDLVAETYDVLNQHRQLSLGIDDLLMSISSSKDEHVYLLQQALEGRRVPVARAANADWCDPAAAWSTDKENLRRMRLGMPVTFAPGSAELVDCSYDQIVDYYRRHPQMLCEGQTPEIVARRMVKRRMVR